MEREERLKLRRRGQTSFLVSLLEEIRKNVNNMIEKYIGAEQRTFHLKLEEVRLAETAHSRLRKDELCWLLSSLAFMGDTWVYPHSYLCVLQVR